MNWWGRCVKFGFRLLYHEMAFTYDSVSKLVSLGEWREWQRTVFEFLPMPEHSGIVLELAHGTGDLQHDLITQGYSTIGLDISAQMGKIALRKLHKSGLSVKLIRASGCHLPFPNGYFNYVICTFPTNFIFQQETLGELWRVMKQNGQVIVVLDGEFTQATLQTKAIEVAYHVTHQRTPHNMGTMIDGQVQSHRFYLEWYKITHKKSQSSVIILKKD